jgi:PEP-CTERM motif
MKSEKKGVPHEGSGLSEDLSKRLAAYALAAGAAAGMGLMGAAATAEASIISKTTSLSLSCPTSPGRGFAHLDLGITKSVQLSFQDYCTNFRSGAVLAVGGPVSIANASTSRIGFLRPAAARLGKGSPIQGFLDAATSPVGLLAARGCCSLANQGNWFPSSPASTSGPARARGYLGFEFGPTGGEHVGWVAMSVANSFPNFAAHITGYAYDTVAGQTIRAGQTSAVPEPGTLALLALGAAGLAALRKRKGSAVSHHESAG